MNPLPRLEQTDLEMLDELRADLYDLGAAVLPGLGEGGEELTEGGQVVTRYGREVGAAVERLQIRGEEDRHRPAAAAR